MNNNEEVDIRLSDGIDSQSSSSISLDKRMRYRELLNEAEVNNTTVEMSLPELTERLKEMNNLFDQHMPTREMAMDSSLLCQYASMGNVNAQNLNTNLITFNPLDYSKRVKCFIQSNTDAESEDILQLKDFVDYGHKVSRLFKSTPKNIFLLGTFPKHEIKERKTRAPTAKIDPNSQKNAPERVAAMGKSDQEMTSEEVERILKILRSKCRQYGSTIDYFEFIVDPQSFSRTVENMFHFTFLIKDGFVQLAEDSDGLLTIELLELRDKNQPVAKAPENAQEGVISINTDQWRRIVEAYKIQIAMIPPRSNANKRSS